MRTLYIFTYAPAGLGHLRVMDALMEGMPKEAGAEILGADDRFIRWVHRLTSNNPLFKRVFEAFQHGFLEEIFTRIYVHNARVGGKLSHKELLKAIDRHPNVDKVVIVATHFGLAHRYAAARKRAERESGKKIALVVQVTDATWQHVWYVKGADVTFVPSKKVKQKLLEYAYSRGGEMKFEVIPYPMSLNLTKKLPKDVVREIEFENPTRKIDVAVPISGAGVGLPFLVVFLTSLHRLTNRFRFYIVAKNTPYNRLILMVFKNKDWVKLITADSDRGVVDLYERLYRERLIDMEVTKPSEQAFKAILEHDTVGGALMMFADPVGRQEDDNLEFLQYHHLIPGCRGIVLPKDPMQAAQLVYKMLSDGTWLRMVRCKIPKEEQKSGELGGDGVRQFWEKVIGLTQ